MRSNGTRPPLTTLMAAHLSGSIAHPCRRRYQPAAGAEGLAVADPACDRAIVYYATPRARMLAMADELYRHVQAGRIAGEPRLLLPREQAAEAHRALESRGTTAATVLVPERA